MKKILLSLIAGAVAATSTYAQEAESAPLTLSGSVDTYYRTTLNTSDSGPLAAPGTSFANGTGFNIGMVNLKASKEGDKTGFVADVVFGPRGAAAGANEDLNNVVNQLYAYYNVTDKLTFTLGRFNTYLGYEYISPVGNYNYSTSYLFTNGPFSHTGAKVNYALTDKLSVMVAALDNVDVRLDKSKNNLMIGGQVGYVADKFSVYANYLGGSTGDDGAEDNVGLYNQIDLTAGFQATEDLFVGLNASTRSITLAKDSADNFTGVALYVQNSFSDKFSLGLRAEQFMTKNNKILNTVPVSATDFNVKGSVTALTLSGRYKVGDLTIIPELRTDLFGKASTDKNVAATKGYNLYNLPNSKGDLKKAITSFSIAAVYAF